MTRDELQEQLKLRPNKKRSIRIAEYMQEYPEEIPDLLGLLQSNVAAAKNIAWAIMTLTDRNSNVLTDHEVLLIDAGKKHIHPAVARNVMRYFQHQGLYNRQSLEQYLDWAFEMLSDSSVPIAIRAFAMQGIETHTKNYPDLRQALADMIAMRIDEESPGFKSRGVKILQLLTKEGIYPS